MAEDSRPVAIKVNNVSKDFRLPHERTRSIKGAFLNMFRSKHQREVETQHALKDISFEVKQGEFFGILGRNGSGKSTLLKILAEIYRPTNGSVQIQGKLVPFIELGVGFNPELTGRENVYLSAALSGFSRAEVDEMYDDIVEFAELEAFMDQKLKNYSSGMQVRLAFSVATRSKADILLIDEVLAVGDADFQRKCFNYFKSLKKSGTTVVFVSHDMDAVREYCDRAILIEESQVIKTGTADEVAQTYTKLFTDITTGVGSGDAESNRWGNGDIRTETVVAELVDDVIQITQNVISNKNIAEPVIGIRIRSVSGEGVTGTNTKIERKRIGQLQKGDKVTLKWVLPAVLASGDYFIDQAITASDGITVYDWWDEATTLTVKRDRAVPYLIDPGFKVKLTMD